MSIAPFRDETLKDATALRLRLNEVVKRVNESSLRTRSMRVDNVQSGVAVVLDAPGFIVGAVVLGGVTATAGAAAPTAAPWVSWTMLGDGRVSVTVNGLTAAPALFAVNLVLHELEGAS